MGNELTLTKRGTEAGAVSVWSDSEKIRALFAPTLSSDEFELFMSLGASLGANPFLREIHAVKYGSSPAAVFLGRDFYRRAAQSQPDYNGHVVQSVHQHDRLEIETGQLKVHIPNLAEPGALLGAYCIVFFKAGRIPLFHYVRFAEYNSGKALWAMKPTTMIEKVAEAQALRQAFAGVFSGTYSEDEKWDLDQNGQAQRRPEPAFEQKTEPAPVVTEFQPTTQAKAWTIEEIRAICDPEMQNLIKTSKLNIGQVRSMFKLHKGDLGNIRRTLENIIDAFCQTEARDDSGNIYAEGGYDVEPLV